MDRMTFLKPSPYESDMGTLVGKTPKEVGRKILEESGLYEKSPLDAIRAKCFDCVGDMSEIRKCVCYTCPLWHLRMGKNPLYGKGQDDEDSDN